MANLFARKPLKLLLAEAQESGEHSLKRTLGPFQLTALGVGAVIGAGIFVFSGLGAHYAGPGLMLSFVLSGMGCAFAALCYAEFAAMIPLAGSAYTYAYATLGELFAWIISTCHSGWPTITGRVYAKRKPRSHGKWRSLLTLLWFRGHKPFYPRSQPSCRRSPQTC